MVGRVAKALVIAGDRLGQPPQRPQGIAQVFESLNIARPEVECLAVGRDGLLEPPLILKGVAQVVMRLGVVGLESQGLAKAGLGLVEPPSRLEDNPQVIPGLGKVGGQPQCVLVVVDRGLQVLALVVNQTQEEPGLAREWILPCYLEEGLLGSRQVTGPKQAAGDRQGLPGRPSGDSVRGDVENETAVLGWHGAAPAFRDKSRPHGRG